MHSFHGSAMRDKQSSSIDFLAGLVFGTTK